MNLGKYLAAHPEFASVVKSGFEDNTGDLIRFSREAVRKAYAGIKYDES